MTARPGRPLVVTACVLAGVLAAGCGPTLSLEVGVREPSVDLVYGAPKEQPAPRPADASYVDTSAPGLVAAPVRLDRPASATPRTQVVAPTSGKVLRPVACRQAGSLEVPNDAAPTTVTAAPKAGLYRFRRTGTSRSTDPGGTSEQLRSATPRPLAAEVVREVKNVAEQRLSPDSLQVTYDVVETEPGLRTTTSYEIDPIGTGAVRSDTNRDAGVRITRIMTERIDLPGDTVAGAPVGAPQRGGRGAEVFVPSPPVKIVDLPLRPQTPPPDNSPQQYDHGVDALTGTSIDLYRQTIGRTRVDACGTVVDAWRVQVSDPQHGKWSTYTTRNGRQFRFGGSITFAPQLGMIVADDLTFGGPDAGDLNEEQGGRRFELVTQATINHLNPERP